MKITYLSHSYLCLFRCSYNGPNEVVVVAAAAVDYFLLLRHKKQYLVPVDIEARDAGSLISRRIYLGANANNIYPSISLSSNAFYCHAVQGCYFGLKYLRTDRCAQRGSDPTFPDGVLIARTNTLLK
eukprot:jgi/Psemu1/304288/fgenesh1_kg.144_\